MGKNMIWKPTRAISLAALLTGLLIGLAFAVTHTKPGAPCWQHLSGHTLTQVGLLPRKFWGFGTTPMHLITEGGAPVNGGTTTRYGFFTVDRFDLRVWRYDPKSGMVFYCTG